MRTVHALVGAVLMAVTPLSFAEVSGTAAGYLWKGGVDTAGIGAQGWMGIGNTPVFISARLQAGEVGNFDYNEARAGGGLGIDLGKGAGFFAGLEAIRTDIEDVDDIGAGLFVGAVFSPADKLSVTAEAGIVDIGSEFDLLPSGSEGSEFSLSAAYAFSKMLSFGFERREAVVTGAITTLGAQFKF
jgi:hypothetical protein